jgi:hypothetical protein
MVAPLKTYLIFKNFLLYTYLNNDWDKYYSLIRFARVLLPPPPATLVAAADGCAIAAAHAAAADSASTPRPPRG